MNNCIIYTIEEQQAGKKTREYLRGVHNLSTRLIRGAAKEGRIKANNKTIKLDYILKYGDEISIQINKEESQNIEPEQIDIDVVYEDRDILVVNKPPFMVVHPTRSHFSGTLANCVMYYFKETNQDCIVRLVSRLDMNTSGLIILAKNQFSHMSLAREMQKDDFVKGYLAIIHGNMREEQGTIDLPIYKAGEAEVKRVVDERGQHSVTHYTVIERFKNANLVKLILETGRTHQIRVHLSNEGHPIFGDSLYGNLDEEYINRQALHAYKLKFPNPRTGEIINLEVDIPEDMKNLLIKLRNQ